MRQLIPFILTFVAAWATISADERTLAFSWGKWTAVRENDWLYIWSEQVALEFYITSNGWFNSFIDGNSSTVYPSGPEQETVYRDTFIAGLQRVRSCVQHAAPEPIQLTNSGSTKVTFGNWVLTFKKEKELLIRNEDIKDPHTVLQKDLSGFFFSSSLYTNENYFTANILLDELPQFAATSARPTTARAPPAAADTTPADDDKQVQPCEGECVADTVGSSGQRRYWSLVREHLQGSRGNDKLQPVLHDLHVMTSILNFIQEYERSLFETADDAQPQ